MLAVDGVVPAAGYTLKPMAQILRQTTGLSSFLAYGLSGACNLGATLEEKIGIPTVASPELRCSKAEHVETNARLETSSPFVL